MLIETRPVHLSLAVLFLGVAGVRRRARNLPTRRPSMVVVVDQTGAVVNDAKVTVINSATGATRDATSGADGTGDDLRPVARRASTRSASPRRVHGR